MARGRPGLCAGARAKMAAHEGAPHRIPPRTCSADHPIQRGGHEGEGRVRERREDRALYRGRLASCLRQHDSTIAHGQRAQRGDSSTSRWPLVLGEDHTHTRQVARDAEPFRHRIRLRGQHGGSSAIGDMKVQRALPVVLLLSLSCTLTETQAATIPTPKWMWDVEMTRPLLDGQNTAILSLPMPHYACTKEPEKIYAPAQPGPTAKLAKTCAYALILAATRRPLDLRHALPNQSLGLITFPPIVSLDYKGLRVNFLQWLPGSTTCLLLRATRRLERR